eukprot:SAG11_NODE_7347_length_1157_cov_2.379017_2_plen_87_part_00
MRRAFSAYGVRISSRHVALGFPFAASAAVAAYMQVGQPPARAMGSTPAELTDDEVTSMEVTAMNPRAEVRPRLFANRSRHALDEYD